jgi:hypothetical protein
MKTIKNNKQVRVWMETVLAYFKILFGHLLEQKFQYSHMTPSAPKYKEVKNFCSTTPAKILFSYMKL